MHTTTHRYLNRTRRPFRPGIALAALAATCATLSLAVLTPAALPHTDPDRAEPVAARRAPTTVEVAIVPATIEVVGSRASRTARAPSPYLPAAWQPRG
ncbi:MAG: hypothetical protein U1F10_01490 [Burkholderiales bacterium]